MRRCWNGIRNLLFLNNLIAFFPICQKRLHPARKRWPSRSTPGTTEAPPIRSSRTGPSRVSWKTRANAPMPLLFMVPNSFIFSFIVDVNPSSSDTPGRRVLKRDSRTAVREDHTMTNPKLLTQKEEMISWLDRVRSSERFEVEPIALNKSNAWVQEQGTIRHVSGRFFGIIGLTWLDERTQYWQPFIDQREIGTLGFIVRRRKEGLIFSFRQKRNRAMSGSSNWRRAVKQRQATANVFTVAMRRLIPSIFPARWAKSYPTPFRVSRVRASSAS